MAITGPELQTAFGDGNPRLPKVLRQLPPYGGASQYWLIHGGQPYQGRVRKVATTAASDAATQAAAILVLLAAGVAP